MISNKNHDYTYRSGNMMVLALMFLVFFSAGLTVVVLSFADVLHLDGPALSAAIFLTLLTGFATWNFEVGIELHDEGLYFIHLLKPRHFVPYSNIQRVGIRMLRGWYYCFMRWGDGLFSGTFFPVEYWMRPGKESTHEFLDEVARRAHLVQTRKTMLGAPIYERRTDSGEFDR